MFRSIHAGLGERVFKAVAFDLLLLELTFQLLDGLVLLGKFILE